MRCPRCKSTNIAVVMYKCNYSAFNGYRRTSSDYSLIRCQEPNCCGTWRSKAKGVDCLPLDRQVTRRGGAQS